MFSGQIMPFSSCLFCENTQSVLQEGGLATCKSANIEGRLAVPMIDSPLVEHQYHKDFANKCCILFLFLGKIFEQFVKTRIREEYKEKKNKLLLAKEEFKKLLEESKLSPRYSVAS